MIDIIGDVNQIYFSKQGSKDLSEFLGRSGISLLKAGATAAIGGLLAAVFTAVAIYFLGTAVLSVAIAALIAVAGYVVAATVVDLVDDGFSVKDTVANWSK